MIASTDNQLNPWKLYHMYSAELDWRMAQNTGDSKGTVLYFENGFTIFTEKVEQQMD